MKLLFTTLLFLTACSGYQNDPKNFDTITENLSSAPAPTQTDTTDTDLTANSFDDVFQKFLDEYVVVLPTAKYDTRVDYKSYSDDLKNKKAEIIALRKEIIDYFGSNTFNTLNTNEQIAFLTNAYNFFVIDLIASKYPIKQIFDATPGEEVFKKNFMNIAGEVMSLDYLEKTKLTTVLKTKLGNPSGKLTDARLHFALICGALGCPILLDKVYKGETLEAQLEDITRKAFALPRMIQNKGSHYSLVQLFSKDWYSDDFDNHSSEDLPSVSSHKEFIAKYFPGSYDFSKNLKVDIKYNWDLNKL